MSLHRFPGDANIKNKQEQISKIAKRILKATRVGKKKLIEEMENLLTSTKLRLRDYGSTSKISRAAKRLLETELKMANLGIWILEINAVSQKVAERKSICSITEMLKSFFGKSFFFKKSIWYGFLFLEGSNKPHAVNTKFCSSVYEGVRNCAQRYMLIVQFFGMTSVMELTPPSSLWFKLSLTNQWHL